MKQSILSQLSRLVRLNFQNSSVRRSLPIACGMVFLFVLLLCGRNLLAEPTYYQMNLFETVYHTLRSTMMWMFVFIPFAVFTMKDICLKQENHTFEISRVTKTLWLTAQTICLFLIALLLSATAFACCLLVYLPVCANNFQAGWSAFLNMDWSSKITQHAPWILGVGQAGLLALYLFLMGTALNAAAYFTGSPAVACSMPFAISWISYIRYSPFVDRSNLFSWMIAEYDWRPAAFPIFLAAAAVL